MLEVLFRHFMQENDFFYKESSSRSTGKYCYSYIFFIVLIIVEQFQTGARLQRPVDLYNGDVHVLFDFTLWAFRALVYNARNVGIVDSCSVVFELEGC